MKKLILIILSFILLTSCTLIQEQEDVSQATSEKSFDNMTEDERISGMIEAIEAKEAEMEESGEL